MSQFKTIGEWMKLGVEPIGFLNEDGDVVEAIGLNPKGLSIKVAPPAQRRLSDEGLLKALIECVSASRMAAIGHDEFRSLVKEADETRTQILQRMKGPTRGEVRKALGYVLGYRDGTKSREREIANFLSMFPEGE
ncbi:hypothetical protein [Nitratireductor basaltis]|uniref:Uncharacterized protein n=1 Tax=Nitratireductor basaltis TaxID=472175 RepID=A0A084UBN6_9HYPH|nr:hypothetical protein [Nitratireductor basaltis]KFB10372.1 hypothetical protein EL18_01403 [Nitratireductor basaltis]